MARKRQYDRHGVNGLKKYLLGVAVAVTTALLGQSMALVWWASAISVRVEHAEKDLDRLSGRVYVVETGRWLRTPPAGTPNQVQ